MPFIHSVDNERIYYEELGEGDITLVLVAGWLAPNGREIWKYQLSFASNYKLVLIDLAGYGKSGNERKTHTLELYGQDVKAVAEHLDLTNIILIGQSLGGAVILEATKLLLNRVVGLIPVDALIPDSTYSKMNEYEIEKMMQPYKEDFLEATSNLVDTLTSEKCSPKDIASWKKSIQLLDKDAMISALTELGKWDFEDVLPLIKPPIKSIMAGRTLPSKEQREKYLALIDAVFIEDIGHFMYIEDPPLFNKVLTEVIQELL